MANYGTYLGSKKIKKIYLGDKKVKKAFLGEKLVYRSLEPIVNVIANGVLNTDNSLGIAKAETGGYAGASPWNGDFGVTAGRYNAYAYSTYFDTTGYKTMTFSMGGRKWLKLFLEDESGTQTLVYNWGNAEGVTVSSPTDLTNLQGIYRLYLWCSSNNSGQTSDSAYGSINNLEFIADTTPPQ